VTRAVSRSSSCQVLLPCAPPGGQPGAANGVSGGGEGADRRCAALPAIALVTRVAYDAPGGHAGGGLLPLLPPPRSVALHLMPRFVVHNGLSAAVQLRQLGA
jgi:hypothetical protein